jgi:polyisoprenoid-binding protein YceI
LSGSKQKYRSGFSIAGTLHSTVLDGVNGMRISQQTRQHVPHSGFLKIFSGLCLSLSLVAGYAQADWQLLPTDSSLTFTSTKNAQLTETHSFAGLSGAIKSQGAAEISIPLASVETLVPIRNERLRVMLFETQTFPLALVSANLTLEPLLTLNVGESMTQEVPLTINLHGISQTQAATLNVVRLAVTDFKVTTVEPLLVDVADFGLADGVQALREIAGLKSIDAIIPVSLSLHFRQMSEQPGTSADTPF